MVTDVLPLTAAKTAMAMLNVPTKPRLPIMDVVVARAASRQALLLRLLRYASQRRLRQPSPAAAITRRARGARHRRLLNYGAPAAASTRRNARAGHTPTPKNGKTVARTKIAKMTTTK